MAFIPQNSVIAQRPIVSKTHLRSKAFPCFSKLQNEARPFFIQWHITALDIVRIRSVNYTEARQEMQHLRNYYGKSKHEVVTIEEYCAFSKQKQGYVRMHIMSRKMENELKREFQIKTVNSNLRSMSCEL